MMNILRALSCRRLSCALLFWLVGVTASRGQGFLKAQGHYITDGNGRTLILRGMGLGGWMLQEGYMLHLSNLGQQYKIRAAIEEVTSPEYAARFYEQWLANDIRRADIDSLKAWGFNSVRLPMHYALYTLPVDKEPVVGKNTWLEKGFALTDSLLRWCKANHMYLILDLHATPGGQGNDLPISDRHPDQPSLWESRANQEKMIALWRRLAARYANEPYIGGYDIINEPNWGFEDPNDKRGTAETKNIPLRNLMVEVTGAIREVDKNHLIIIEGNGFGNNYRGIFPKWDDNMAVSFHKYGNFNNQAAIQNFLTIREQNNVPLWMGESGENSNTWFTEAIRLVESNGIGWSWWPLKKMGINNPLEIKVSPGYQHLLDYWSGKGAKPSQAEAMASLNALLNNIRLENNIYHKDVTNAMFRQVHSFATLPFKEATVGRQAVIQAVDYDLGAQRSAYYDKDTASYQYTPGVNTIGNRGHAYRNDGVDIEADSNGYHIFNIEDGEWLHYTFKVQRGGKYKVILLASANADSSNIRLMFPGWNTVVFPPGKAMPTEKKQSWKKIEFTNIPLQAGINRLTFIFNKGGFTFKSFEVIRL